MNLGITEEQEILRKTARDFLEKECPKSLVREMEVDDKGFSPELWRKMAALGWMGLIFPEEYEGTAGSFLDLVVLFEEMGRALVPSPFVATVVYCGLPLLAVGSKKQKREFLPKIARGELILALALTEPNASYDAVSITMEAVAEKDGYVISGTKLFVLDAHVADYMLCAAKTDGQGGLTLFLVPAKSKGITCTVLQTIASDKQCEVVFDRVRVPRENILGELGQGRPIVQSILEYGAVALCSTMLGGAQQVLEMTVNYAKERIQFDRPIGSFQAIQHRCANMLTYLEASRYITYKAAWELSENIPAATEASMAKAWVSEAYRQICLEGHQIHGGIGFTKDHDMQLYLRRAKAAEVALGDTDFHREILARQLGL